MRHLLLMLSCWLCYAPILRAQITPKLLGNQIQAQAFIQKKFEGQPALSKMTEILKDNPSGQWEVIESSTQWQFFLDQQLMFNFGIEDQINADGLYCGTSPTFYAHQVDVRHPTLSKTFSRYQVFQLDAQAIWDFAKAENDGKFKFNLMLANHKWPIDLRPNDFFAENLKIKVLSRNGIQYQEISNYFYEGTVGGKQEDQARFTIAPDHIMGLVQKGEEEFMLEPLPSFIGQKGEGLYVLYKTSDVLSNPEWSCGSVEAEKHHVRTHHHDHSTNRMPDPGCYDVTELALAAAYDMVEKFGTIGATAAHLFEITASMELLFETFDLDYKIVDIVIPSSEASDPWSTSAFMDILLPDFATWGNTGSNFEPHDIGQLWVARNVFRGSVEAPEFGLIGRADGIGVVCTADRYNVCEDFDASISCLRSLSAHEIGHLWDGIHGDATEGVTIMSPTIVCAATAFTAANQTNIQNHINSRACLEEDCCRLIVDCSNIIDQDLDCRSDLPPVDLDLPIISEACGVPAVSVLTIIPSNSGCPGNEVLITRTYFIQDDGDLFQCYQEFTVESTNGPSASCPITEVDLDADCNYSLENLTNLVNATAECNDFSISVAQISPSPGTVYSGEQTVNVSMEVTDECGRTDNCNILVILRDNTPPIINQCDGGFVDFNGEESIPSSDAIALDVEDNCGVASVTYDPPTIFCEELGDDIIVTVEITDIYGNTSVCSPIVTVDGLPCGWMNTDGIGCIGNNEADYDVPTETFTLTSDGCTPSYPYISDNQSFIKYEMCGDGYIKAYVDQINGHAYAGVELRNSIAANAKKVAMGTNTVNRLIRIARVLENYPAWPQQVFSLDKFWVKIERSGNIFRAYASPDDVIYFPYLFQFIPMDECTQVGLFVYSSTPGDVVTADFTNVEVVLGTPFTAGTPSDIEQNIAQQQSLNIGLTPNPARDEVLLNLHSFLGEDLMISIFNIQGQLMEHIALDKVEEATEVFAVDHLPEGTYYVNIRNSEKQQTLKLIIQR